MGTPTGSTENYVAYMLDDIARQYGTPPSAEAGTTEGSVPGAYVRPSQTEDSQEKLSSMLEAHNASIRRSMMDFHKEMRSQLLAEQRAAVESERHAATLRLQAKQEEIELLKDDLSVTCAAAAAAEVRVQRSCDHIARLNERWRDRRYMASYFKTWAEGWRWEKRDKRGEAKAVRWYEVEVLQRKTMRLWFHNSSTRIKQTVKASIRDAVAKTQAEGRQETGNATAELRAQLLETQRALVAEKQGREMLAQDMKRSFMRGVCALNMEAMQVMKRGMAPGGMNPSATTVQSQYIPPDDGEPQPEAVPANLQNMLSAMNMGPAAADPASLQHAQQSSPAMHGAPAAAPRSYAVRHG